jgi:hygromycin-B 7''-O-kinase
LRRTTRIEAAVLDALAGALPLRTPGLHAAGELDGWPYIIMEELPGTPLCDCREQIPAADWLIIAEHLGESLAALHRVSTRFFPSAGPRWAPFIAAQAAGCVEHQRRRGVADEWLEQIPDFLARVERPASGPLVLLHTEVMHDHLLAIPTSSGWRLSGLIDFEPAMPGEREYEFASVGLFVSRGDAGLFRAILEAYGYDASQLGIELGERFMAYALLHRYSNLKWYLETVPTRSSRTFEELAAAWWGSSPN